MNTADIFILAFALALDALIVSFSYGLIIKTEKLKNSLALSGSFGFFQFIMPIIGWHFTSVIYNYLKIYSKWVVFIIFTGLALKFLKESFSKKKETNIQCINLICIVGLALATSIDAFGTGISIRFMEVSVLKSALIIGIVTFILSITGFYSAGKLCNVPSKIIGIISFLLLMYLAVTALI